MNISDGAHELSLAATIPTLWLGWIVVRIWAADAFRVLMTYKEAASWMVLGVVLHFSGSVGDNFYWFIAWTASYLGHDWKEFLFSNGVYPNIILRQISGIAAAFCHIKSAEVFLVAKGKNPKFSAENHLIISSLMGVAVWMVLRYLKG